jgi:hypothetical protein
VTDFNERKSTDNWARVDFDENIWIPIPYAFQGTRWKDAAEWAFDYAGSRFLLGGRDVNKKVVKHEVLPSAQALVRARDQIVGHAKAAKFYFHCPDYTKVPVATFVGLFKCMGTRDEAFEYYAYWGTKSATTQPVAEWFETEHLGTGVKAQWAGRLPDDGRPYDQVNYIFRNEEFDTDVQVWTTVLDHDRFVEVVPDLDTFVRAIRCTPDPSNKPAAGNAGS